MKQRASSNLSILVFLSAYIKRILPKKMLCYCHLRYILHWSPLLRHHQLAVYQWQVENGTALKCYLCAGSTRSDCAKSRLPSLVVDSCRAPQWYTPVYHPLSRGIYDGVGDMKQYCLTITINDPEFKPAVLMRSCSAFPDNVDDPCEFMKQHVKVKWCKSCVTDLCNKKIYEEEDEDSNAVF